MIRRHARVQGLNPFRVTIQRDGWPGSETLYVGLPCEDAVMYVANGHRLMVVAADSRGNLVYEGRLSHTPINVWPALRQAIHEASPGGIKIRHILSIDRVCGSVMEDILAGVVAI